MSEAGDERVGDRMDEFGLVLMKNHEALLREIGCGPAPWTTSSERHEAVATAKCLLHSSNDTLTGLAKLTESDRLDQSLEWFVLVYADLFGPEDRQHAYQRLRSTGAPVDQWLVERLSRHLP